VSASVCDESPFQAALLTRSRLPIRDVKYSLGSVLWNARTLECKLVSSPKLTLVGSISHCRASRQCVAQQSPSYLTHE